MGGCLCVAVGHEELCHTGRSLDRLDEGIGSLERPIIEQIGALAWISRINVFRVVRALELHLVGTADVLFRSGLAIAVSKRQIEPGLTFFEVEIAIIVEFYNEAVRVREHNLLVSIAQLSHERLVARDPARE